MRCTAFIRPSSTYFPPRVATTPRANRLTVRLLEAGTGTVTTELLWLTPSVVGNEEGTVVLDEGLLQLVLGVLVDKLLVVCDLCPIELVTFLHLIANSNFINEEEYRRTIDFAMACRMA